MLGVSKEGPQAIIESVALDHTDLGQPTRVVMEPGQSNLEIQYTALNFSKPEQIEFRYKLDGIDRNGSMLDDKELRSINTYLPATMFFM